MLAAADGFCVVVDAIDVVVDEPCVTVVDPPPHAANDTVATAIATQRIVRRPRTPDHHLSNGDGPPGRARPARAESRYSAWSK
jgi:hypothetical protein